MNDENKPETVQQPPRAEQKRHIMWTFEKDFVTDTKSGLALRLERHIEKKPTNYRWTFGVMIRQADDTMKFILGVRPWIDRRGGQVTVRDESAIMLMLMQRMQEYIAEKEQAVEDEWRRTRPQHDGQGKGLKQWAKHDKEKHEAREREARERGGEQT